MGGQNDPFPPASPATANNPDGSILGRSADSLGLYARLLENVTDVAFWGTNEGVVESVAPSVQALLGWTPTDLEGTAFLELVHPDDVTAVSEVQRDLLNGKSGVLEIRLRTADADWRWVSVTVSPVLDDSGAVQGRVALARDVHERVLTCQALAQREAWLRQLTETMPSGMVVHAGDGTIVDANPAAEALLGLSREQLLGRHPIDPRWKAIRPDGTELPGELHPATLTHATGQRQQAVMGVKRPDGTRVWLNVVSVPLDPAHHDESSVLAMFSDVTPVVDAEHRLAESEERFRHMVEDVGDVLVRTDPAGVLTNVSGAIEWALGWSAQDLIGKRMADLVHPDDVAKVAEAARKPGSAPQMILGRLRHKDGSYRWIQSVGRWLRSDSDNQVVGVVAVWRDVTRQVENEHSLRESEERYRLIAENATDVVFRVGLDGTINWVSESVEGILGIPAAEIMGGSGFGGVHPDDLTVAAQGLQEALTGRQPRMRLRVQAADGQWRWVSIRMSPLHDEDGSVVGLTGGWSDVTTEVEDELALVAERARLRAVLDSLLDPHVLASAVRDASGEVVDLVFEEANDRARAPLPGQPEALVGRTLTSVVPRRVVEQVLVWCRSAIDRGEAVAIDEAPWLADGQEVRWLDVRVVPVGDLISLTWRDVTERARKHQRLLETEANTRQLLDTFDPALAHLDASPDRLYRTVREGLADGAPRMVYQRIVDMRRSSTIVGYEALARFPDTWLGGPAGWFAGANRVGLGVPLELMAIRRALAILPQLPEATFLSVNVSPLTVTEGLHELLSEDIPWHRLILELTEHMPVEDYDLVNEALAPLRRRGVKIAVDDTGAGFASLRHILDLRPDIIKLDIGLVRGIDRDENRAGVARMLLDFSRSIDARAIAEGVETPAERDTLLQLGAILGQGYLFGRPEQLASPGVSGD